MGEGLTTFVITDVPLRSRCLIQNDFSQFKLVAEQNYNSKWHDVRYQHNIEK